MRYCQCGAADCYDCHSENFVEGVCMVDLTCRRCDGDWAADTMDERERGLCPECAGKKGGEL